MNSEKWFNDHQLLDISIEWKTKLFYVVNVMLNFVRKWGFVENLLIPVSRHVESLIFAAYPKAVLTIYCYDILTQAVDALTSIIADIFFITKRCNHWNSNEIATNCSSCFIFIWFTTAMRYQIHEHIYIYIYI